MGHLVHPCSAILSNETMDVAMRQAAEERCELSAMQPIQRADPLAGRLDDQLFPAGMYFASADDSHYHHALRAESAHAAHRRSGAAPEAAGMVHTDLAIQQIANLLGFSHNSLRPEYLHS